MMVMNGNDEGMFGQIRGKQSKQNEKGYQKKGRKRPTKRKKELKELKKMGIDNFGLGKKIILF